MKRVLLFCFAVFFLIISNQTIAQQIPDEARRHFNRGLVAAELARSNEGYEKAIDEFKLADTYAPPFWPDVYYNLGLLYEKIEDYDGALRNFKKYIKLLPNAPDQDKIKQTIDVLEFKKEKSEKLQLFIKILCDPDAEWISKNRCNHANNTVRFKKYGSVVKAEVVDYTRMDAWAKKAIPPPIPDIWVPIRFEGNHFYYEYIKHCTALAGTPHYRPYLIQVSIEGELISYDPPRLKLKWKQTIPKELDIEIFEAVRPVPSCEDIYE